MICAQVATVHPTLPAWLYPGCRHRTADVEQEGLIVRMADVSETIRPDNWEAKQITGEVSKFTAYVLVPGHPSGKDKVFRDAMGYDIPDAPSLLNSYIAQARARFDAKDYTVGRKDRYGQRFAIVVELQGKGGAAGRTYRVQSGWILDREGTLKLATPFAGFAD